MGQPPVFNNGIQYQEGVVKSKFLSRVGIKAGIPFSRLCMLFTKLSVHFSSNPVLLKRYALARLGQKLSRLEFCGQ